MSLANRKIRLGQKPISWLLTGALIKNSDAPRNLPWEANFLRCFRKLISERNTELGVREESWRDLTYLLRGRVWDTAQAGWICNDLRLILPPWLPGVYHSIPSDRLTLLMRHSDLPPTTAVVA